MDDLLGRLRSTWAWSHDRPVNPDGADAADRIEQLNLDIVGLKIKITQLEAALRSLFGTFMELNMAHKECDCHECSVIRAARAALGEKKDA